MENTKVKESPRESNKLVIGEPEEVNNHNT